MTEWEKGGEEMEAMILAGIGLAALGYVFYVIWRSIRGKSECNCGCSGSCPAEGCCNPKPVHK